MSTLYYTSVDRAYNVVPAIGSVSNLTSAMLCDAFAVPAEAIMNAKLAKLYSVPITPAPPVLSAIADDIFLYRVLTRRVFNQQQLKDSAWPDRFKEALDLLSDILTLQMPLITDVGSVIPITTDFAQVVSNNSNYDQTFTEADPYFWVQDLQKIDDILTERQIDIIWRIEPSGGGYW